MFKSIICSVFKTTVGRVSALSLVVISVLILSAITVFAGSTSYSGDIDGTEPRENACGSDLTDKIGPFQVSVTDTYTFDSTSSTGVDIWLTTASTFASGSPAPAGFPRTAAPDSRTQTLTAGIDYWVIIINPCDRYANGSWSITITGPGITSPIAVETTTEVVDDTVYPPDDRINWQYGDLNVVVYDHDDGVVAYCYDGNTWVGLHVNQAAVDNAVAGSQDVPVLEYEEYGCYIAFYILDTGEYQINIWTWDGKLYELVADNLDFANATMRYFDPGE